MAGISSALNIAKNALLAFQTEVHVTSHNVANVDTEGYSRQKVVLTPYPPSPSPVGPIGSGVKVDQIKRYFDAFLEANLNLKRSDLGLFSAEETGMRLVEGIFNEAGDQGLSKLLNDFFSAWQTLSNRPEGVPERRLLVEKGKLLAENLRDKFQSLRDLENNIGLKLKEVVERINDLAAHIAELNNQITAAETGGHQANDLRDQRDHLIAQLAKLAPIRYFETKDGAYNVILGRGFNLVDVDRSWQLEISGTEVYWVGHQGEKARLTGEEVAGGELGGWLRIVEQISDQWNHEYVASTRSVLREDGTPITEDTSLAELGLVSGDKFLFQGTDHFGNAVSGTYTVSDPSRETVRDLLDAIEQAFGFSVTAEIRDGQLIVRDAYRGPGKLTFAFTQSKLDFGRFDDPNLNYRVKELNLAGKLALFAEELIRTVNRIHSSGAGLEFFSGELEGLYQTSGYLKNLPFFRDLQRDGSFFLWVRDSQGHITPVRVKFSLPADATLEEVATQINDALRGAGFTPEKSVQALVRDGRLVFQAQEGWSFAFSNDTSGLLASTGINTFFGGVDAASIEVNPLLSVHPEYVAAARLDREAWRSEAPLVGIYRSRLPVANPDSVVFNDHPHRLYVRFFDARGNQILHETENGFKVQELSVDIEPGDSLTDILNKLDALEGLRAYLDNEGHIVLELDPNSSKGYAYFELGAEDPPPADSFLAYLRDQGVWVPEYVPARGRKQSTLWFDNPSSVSLNEGSEVTLNFVFYDAEGQETGRTSLTVDGSASLSDLVAKLNALPEVRAGFTEGDHGLIYLALDQAPEGSVSFEISVTGGDGDGKLDLSSGKELDFSSVTDRQIFSGLEPWVKPSQYTANLEGISPEDLGFSGNLTVRFFDAEGNEVASKSLATYGTPDVLLSDHNGNGRVDLEDLVQDLDGLQGIKAYLDNGELVIALDQDAPAGAAYFVIEGNDPLRSWGSLKLVNTGGTSDTSDDRYYHLYFRLGALENWLYDERGNPIDADPENDTVDPFRVELGTDQGAVQILKKYNAEENARFGLSGELDSQGRLVVKLSGLYDTRSFVLTEGFAREAFSRLVSANRFEASENRWYFLTDSPVSDEALFFSAPDDSSTSPGDLQFLTLSYQDVDQNKVGEEHIFVRRSDASFTSADSFTLADPSATVEITFYDALGNVLGSPVNVVLASGTTLSSAATALDGLDGVHAEFTDDGHLLLSLRDTEFPDSDPRRGAAFFTVSVNDGGGDNKLTFSDGATTSSITFNGAVRFQDYRREIEALDSDRDGTPDFATSIDPSGRFSLRINDPDLDGDGAADWVRFTLESSLTREEGNLGVYLSRRLYFPREGKGILRELGGFDLKPGDNRNALRLSGLSDEPREDLGQASLPDYYASVVAEVGVAGKRVSEAKNFTEDLLKQLQLLRDSISAVSLDEEMANLMKYQQAFAAAAKVLTASDEMLMTLIEAKR